MKRPRRRRLLPAVYGGWWTVGVSAVIALLGVVGFALNPRDWPGMVAGIALGGFAFVIAALAESVLALQAARLRATQRLGAAHARELGLYADHFARLHNDLRRVDPAAAAAALAALNLDLTRLHALGVHVHRQESHARADA